MMNQSVRARLSVLMFLQYFVWESWYVTLGTYLFKTFQSDAVQVGFAYANLSILIADRYFFAQKVLGILHLIGTLTLY